MKVREFGIRIAASIGGRHFDASGYLSREQRTEAGALEEIQRVADELKKDVAREFRQACGLRVP